ncbi:GAF domain-containing protein [Streptomyces sp. NPDC002004]
MREDEPTGGRAPRLRLDELLDEFQARIEEVRGTRDRLNRLLEAVLSVGRGLDLPTVLRGIVEAAVVLVDAEYGALGVIGEDAALAQFEPVGINDEVRARIGDLPTGHGLLGELIRHPETLRLRELSEHPASSGFPQHHPPMHSFLGAPVRIREEVFGNLYLTEKRGGGEFDAEDETVLSTLAVAAGVAIDNARLFEEVRLHGRWLELSADFTEALLSGASEREVLDDMIQRAREISSSETGVVYLLQRDGTMRGALASGENADRHRGTLLPPKGTMFAAALHTGGLVTATDIANDPRVTYEPGRWKGFGPAVAIPVGTGAQVRGVLLLARRTGRPPFSPPETSPLSGFAAQAALALELADHRRDTEQMSLLADRDRIARDLHDLAIQRLFATGMTLQSAQRFVEHPEAAERLGRAIDDLDITIKIIRSTIFGLREHETPHLPGLRVRAVRTVDDAAGPLGFAPALRMEGLVETDVSPELADEVVAVLNEALSNVARHARAARADVSLVARDGLLTLTVTDDGTGTDFGAGDRGTGLRNLAERAERQGGTLSVERRPSGGTCLVWRVPLDRGTPGGPRLSPGGSGPAPGEGGAPPARAPAPR